MSPGKLFSGDLRGSPFCVFVMLTMGAGVSPQISNLSVYSISVIMYSGSESRPAPDGKGRALIAILFRRFVSFNCGCLHPALVRLIIRVLNFFVACLTFGIKQATFFRPGRFSGFLCRWFFRLCSLMIHHNNLLTSLLYLTVFLILLFHIFYIVLDAYIIYRLCLFVFCLCLLLDL